MLVTSGQISVAISSCVVFLFTSLLFLSGYVLQQQTVRSLQAAIHPASPDPAVPTTNPVLAKHFGRPPGHSFYDKYLASNRPKGGWAKAAYVQLVREHIHVCNAVMLFEVLEAQESMAQRILMYPQEWDQEASTTAAKDRSLQERRSLETSRRLLKRAAKANKVMLQPIAPAGGSTGFADSDAAWTPEERYPLTNLLSLLNLNRIIYLPPSGLLLDATPADLLFTLPLDDHPMLGLSDPEGSRSEIDILLIEPSQQLYQDTTVALPEGAFLDRDVFDLVHMDVALAPSPKTPTTLLAETGTLAKEKRSGSVNNATEFLDQTAYVRIKDEGIPGPEYSVPRSVQQGAMPREREAADAWVTVYERYREARMEICGLDMEPFPLDGGEAGGLR